MPPRSRIRDRMQRGELRRIHGGVYTTDLATRIERIVDTAHADLADTSALENEPGFGQRLQLPTR